jgi:hypothetical protein
VELDNTKCGTDCSDSGRQIRIPPEKSGFDFLGEFVLAEGLGGGAGQQEMRNRPFSSDRQIRIRQKSPGLFRIVRLAFPIVRPHFQTVRWPFRIVSWI